MVITITDILFLPVWEMKNMPDPGTHYYSNEKYMASMFGFPHFVLAKTQPAQDGRFGYWYADVRMENVE